MTRIGIAWCIALALAGLIAIFVSEADSAELSAMEKLKKLERQVLSNTVQINGNCSGTIVLSKREAVTGEVTTLVLSAGHCLSNKDKEYFIDVPVYQDNEVVLRKRYSAIALGPYYKADLTLFRLKDRNTFFENTAKVAPEKTVLYMGEDVVSVGHPLGGVLTVTYGLFGSVETSDFAKPGMTYYRATPDIGPGSSGGGLYHQNAAGDWELIGVTTAGARGFPFIALYTKLSDIRDYLKVAAPEVVGVEGPANGRL